MPRIQNYPYPSYKNPIKLSRNPQLAHEQLKELQKRIISNEPLFQRKNDKIPALPFWFEGFFITLGVLNVLFLFVKHCDME